jgi:lipopolysaccharide/colanic/teichoic acid biosynthesis glycosyltransferase
VRPGITDWASIEFRDESSLLGDANDPESVYRNDILPRKLAYYRRYVRERTFLGDVAIIWQTLKAISKREA